MVAVDIFGLSKFRYGLTRVLIEELIQSLSEVVSVREATDIIESLYRDELLTEREGKIVLTMLSKEALAVGDARMAGQLRGQLLRQLLNRLRFESERK